MDKFLKAIMDKLNMPKSVIIPALVIIELIVLYITIEDVDNNWAQLILVVLTICLAGLIEWISFDYKQ